MGIKKGVAAAVLLAGGLLTSGGLSGQLAIASPVAAPTLDIEVERPFVDNSNGLAFYSSIIRVGARFPVGKSAVFSVEAPLSIVDGDNAREASASIGNLRADLVVGRADGIRGFIGFTGLTATELQSGFSSQVFGLFSALDQLEVWPTDLFSLHAGVVPSLTIRPGTTVGARLGLASVWQGDSDETDVYSRFGAWFRMERASVRWDGEVLGSYLFGENEGFGPSSVIYLDVAATWFEVGGQPGVFIRLPVDDDSRRPLHVSIGARFAIGG